MTTPQSIFDAIQAEGEKTWVEAKDLTSGKIVRTTEDEISQHLTDGNCYKLTRIKPPQNN